MKVAHSASPGLDCRRQAWCHVRRPVPERSRPRHTLRCLRRSDWHLDVRPLAQRDDALELFAYHLRAADPQSQCRFREPGFSAPAGHGQLNITVVPTMIKGASCSTRRSHAARPPGKVANLAIGPTPAPASPAKRPAEALAALSKSAHFDWRLARYDIAGSRTHPQRAGAALVGHVVTARCREPIRLDQLDILNRINGLPCYRCLAWLPDLPTDPGACTATGNGSGR